MTEFTTYIPNSFVSRLVDPIHEHLTRNENHAIVQKFLTYYSVADVASMTNAQKAACTASLHLWQLAHDAEVVAAVATAQSTASTSATDDFVP